MDQRRYALIPVVRSQDYVLDMFYDGHYRMTDSAPPRPASADEIVATLSFALQYEGRKRVHDAAGAMARITTERPVRHLQRRRSNLGHTQGRAGAVWPPADGTLIFSGAV